MVNPSLIGGDHDIFIVGHGKGAKETVMQILKDWCGRKSVIARGDITRAVL
jgi:predicted dinucleotide-binding enzyme